MREIISIHIEHAGIHVGIHAGSSTASSMEFNLMGRCPGFSDFGSLFVGCKILCSQVTPHNEQLSYASPSKKRLDTISDSAKESKQSVFIMDTHTFEMYTSSLNKRKSSSPKKLSRCSIHLPQSNFDEEDPVNNGIGDDPKS